MHVRVYNRTRVWGTDWVLVKDSTGPNDTTAQVAEEVEKIKQLEAADGIDRSRINKASVGVAYKPDVSLERRQFIFKAKEREEEEKMNTATQLPHSELCRFRYSVKKGEKVMVEDPFSRRRAVVKEEQGNRCRVEYLVDRSCEWVNRLDLFPMPSIRIVRLAGREVTKGVRLKNFQTIRGR